MKTRTQVSGQGCEWLEGVVSGLIQHAAQKAPPELSERLAEEWHADLAARRGAIARLSFALGCCRATRIIALELAAPVRAVAAAGGKSTVLAAGPLPELLSRRTTVVVLIGALHVLVIVGLATGLARQVVPGISPGFTVSFVEKTTPRPLPPPPSDLRLATIHPVIKDVWTGEPPAGAITIPVSPEPPSVAAAVSTPPRPVVRVGGGPGAGFPNTDDYYPAQSLRLEEKGVATVRVCVDSAGRLTADPVISQSSGSMRLDGGALRLAKAGSGHYRPASEDGRPVSSCYPFLVRFTLKN